MQSKHRVLFTVYVYTNFISKVDIWLEKKKKCDIYLDRSHRNVIYGLGIAAPYLGGDICTIGETGFLFCFSMKVNVCN